MPERILFLTGRLAKASLCRELEGLSDKDFEYEVRDLGLQVAALMTASMIQRRLGDIGQADRILVPGLCGGNVADLVDHFGIPVEKGPDDLKDIREYFGAEARQTDLSRYVVRIFAEIVDAPHLTVDEILERARAYAADGADVIDLGCLPGTPFEHLEEAVSCLITQGFEVSVDSFDAAELARGGKAGAHYLLSLKESTLDLADEVASVPILIPEEPGDLESLFRAAEAMTNKGKPFLADAILDPIHFGFAESLGRYGELRRRMPQVEIMMGTGNVTELTDADTTGMTGILMGVASELNAAAILTTEVSPHARTAVREADAARRMMHAAKEDGRLPRGYHHGLLALRDRKPFPYTPEEIAETAKAIKDPSFRIQVSEDGIHVFNRDGMHTAQQPFELFPALGVETDGGHAFYLGVELARAQVAWQLGKRYLQDNELHWGCAVQEPDRSDEEYRPPGTTFKGRQ